MERIIPWLALVVASAALVLGLAPAPSPASPAAGSATVAEDPRVGTLEAEVKRLRDELARRPSRSDLEAIERRLDATVPGTGGAPVAGIDEDRVRTLIAEAAEQERQRFAQMRQQGPTQGGFGGNNGPQTEPIDPAALSTKMQESLQLDAAAATAVSTAMAEMQTAMRAAFANGTDREAGIAAMREAREKFQAVVDANVPEDKRDALRGVMAEQMGWRGRGGRDGGDRTRNRDGGDNQGAAPAPTNVKEF